MPTFVPDGAKDSAVHTLDRRKRPRRRHHLVLLVLPRDTRCGHDEDVSIMKLPQNSVLDPKLAKLDQKSGFWRLVSVS